MAATKARYFTGIVYVNEVREDWQDVLRDSLGMFLISPVHEPDPVEEYDASTGGVTMKTAKAHCHVLYKHANTITVAAAKNAIPSGIIANEHLEIVSSPNNLARYFCHLDQPEKQQWVGQKPQDLLVCLNGYPLDLTRELTRQEQLDLMRELIAYIRNHSMTEYADLIDSLMDAGDWQMFDYATHNAMVCKTYLASVRHREKG